MPPPQHNLNARVIKGFTLVELVVAISVLAIVGTIIILLLNPIEYFKRARDAQRLSDAVHINQAITFYNANRITSNKEPDLDGPNYPVGGSPPLTDSCKNDNIPHRIFVSVPVDGGEPLPTPPPTDWEYVAVSSTKLRAVDGTGWLPIDLTETGGRAPLSALPIDPINTFASGYYYSYGCGSWNLNMRFESEKYRDLAALDDGRFPGIFESGTDLNILPVQYAYKTPILEIGKSPDANPPTTWSLSPNNEIFFTNDQGETLWLKITGGAPNSPATYKWTIGNVNSWTADAGTTDDTGTLIAGPYPTSAGFTGMGLYLRPNYENWVKVGNSDWSNDVKYEMK